MAEKKAALVAAIVALAIIGAPLAAFASPVVGVKQISGISIHSEDEVEDPEDEDEDEDESEDASEDEDDEHHASIPPVFVVPGQKRPPHSHKRPSVTQSSGVLTPAQIDPVTGLALTPAPIESLSEEDFVIVGAGSDPAAATLGGVNPKEAKAIDIKRVPVSMRTPADQFMDTAYFGMGMLGFAALGLGTTATVRAVRLRRSGKSDYFYGDK